MDVHIHRNGNIEMRPRRELPRGVYEYSEVLSGPPITRVSPLSEQPTELSFYTREWRLLTNPRDPRRSHGVQVFVEAR